MSDGTYTGKDGGNMKIFWESRLLYVVLMLLVLETRKKTFTQSKF